MKNGIKSNDCRDEEREGERGRRGFLSFSFSVHILATAPLIWRPGVSSITLAFR